MTQKSLWPHFVEWFWTSSVIRAAVTVGMTLALLGIFKVALDRFNPTDELPELKIIDAAKQKEFGALTAKVKTGLFIKSFSDFDIKKNNFVADCVVWFEFNSDEVTQATVGLFSFENGNILSKSEPDVHLEGRKTIATYTVKVAFSSNLNYHHFPLDGHRIALILTNNFVTPQEMFFTVESGAFRLTEGIFIADWVIKDTSTDAGFAEAALDKNDSSKIDARPQAMFVVDVDGKGLRKFLIIFLPILIAIFLAIFSFVSDERALQQRQVLSTASISAIIGYRFVIENLLPPVGYFTTTDYYFVFMLLLAFFIFIFQVLFVWQAAKLPSLEEAAAKRLDYWLTRVNMVAFLLTCGTTVVGIGWIMLLL